MRWSDLPEFSCSGQNLEVFRRGTLRVQFCCCAGIRMVPAGVTRADVFVGADHVPTDMDLDNSQRSNDPREAVRANGMKSPPRSLLERRSPGYRDRLSLDRWILGSLGVDLFLTPKRVAHVAVPEISLCATTNRNVAKQPRRYRLFQASAPRIRRNPAQSRSDQRSPTAALRLLQ